MRDYKTLTVWRKSHEQYLFIKKNILNMLPVEEKYDLRAQLSRASLSIPLNIAEGAGRFSEKEFAHFLNISLGSTNEVDYCCFAAYELNYISKELYISTNKILNEIRAMLIVFIKFLRNKIS